MAWLGGKEWKLPEERMEWRMKSILFRAAAIVPAFRAIKVVQEGRQQTV